MWCCDDDEEPYPAISGVLWSVTHIFCPPLSLSPPPWNLIGVSMRQSQFCFCGTPDWNPRNDHLRACLSFLSPWTSAWSRHFNRARLSSKMELPPSHCVSCEECSRVASNRRLTFAHKFISSFFHCAGEVTKSEICWRFRNINNLIHTLYRSAIIRSV